MFKILLGLNSIKHLEEKSKYNCNYYELDPCGDWCCFFDGNNIVEAVSLRIIIWTQKERSTTPTIQINIKQ